VIGSRTNGTGEQQLGIANCVIKQVVLPSCWFAALIVACGTTTRFTLFAMT
jgi:hypothetical protein